MDFDNIDIYRSCVSVVENKEDNMVIDQISSAHVTSMYSSASEMDVGATLLRDIPKTAVPTYSTT